MHITRFGHAFSVEVPVATAMALLVLCGSTLAQSTNPLPEPGSVNPNADSASQVSPVDTSDPRESAFTSDEVDYSATGDATQRRLRPFGATSNAAPRYIRSDVEVAPWQNLAGLYAASGYRAEISEISSRWWFSTGLTAVGFGVGSVALTARPMLGIAAVNAAVNAAVHAADAGVVLASSPSLSLGIRRRTSAASTVYADATRTLSIGVSGIDSYSGKVGVEWKTAESRWSVAYSGLGMRLTSESRMTVSLRKGGLAVYMRRQF